MRALQIRHNVPRFGLARIASAVAPATATKIGPLEYRTIDDPACPGGHHGTGWKQVRTRLAGICGSDLALVEGHASAYFDDWVSFPFVPGHEVVGELEDGTRVVLEPVLGAAARGLVPTGTPADLVDDLGRDDYAMYATEANGGALEAGIQTGFCCSTGGGWAPWFWAHESQLHPIADDMPDERAVLVEPLAAGIHAAMLAAESVRDIDEPVIAVIGAGTMGLATIAGLRRYLPNARVIVGGRYPLQIGIATALGAESVVPSSRLDQAVRRAVGCYMVGDALSSGADATIDAVGSGASVELAIRVTRPGRRVVMLGMPAEVSIDMTALWHRETELKGAYTYGTETMPDGTRRRTFDLAIETANHFEVERLLSATYPLSEHVNALAHASTAGPRGAIKIAFDLRNAPTDRSVSDTERSGAVHASNSERHL